MRGREKLLGDLYRSKWRRNGAFVREFELQGKAPAREMKGRMKNEVTGNWF